MDGDNILTVQFLEDCIARAQEMRVDMDLRTLPEGGANKFKDLCVVRYKSDAQGTTGRIMIPYHIFHLLGGYDEDMGPSGYQDVDIAVRAKAVGRSVSVNGAWVGSVITNVKGAEGRVKFRDHLAAKVRNIDGTTLAQWGGSWNEMNSRNVKTCKAKLKDGELVRNAEKAGAIGLRVIRVLFREGTASEWLDPQRGVEAPSASGSASELLVSPSAWLDTSRRMKEPAGPATPLPAGPPPAAAVGARATAPTVATAGAAAAIGARPVAPMETEPIPPMPSRPPPRLPLYRVSTFGAKRFVGTFGGHGGQEMKDLVDSRRGGPPVPIPEDLLRQAFYDADLCMPTIFIDARAFTEFDRDVLQRTRGHLGFHPEVLYRMTKHPDLPQVFERVATAAVNATVQQTELSIAIFCKVGEMRSVALATLLSVMLRWSGWEQAAEPSHLSKYYWRYRTCQADPACEFCGGRTRSKMKERAELGAFDVWLPRYQEAMGVLRRQGPSSGSSRAR